VLRARGVAVPDALSLFGFDDVPVARDVAPALSTVRLPLTELGTTAMDLALDEADVGPRTVVLPTELVLRDSSAAAPAHGR
jgi:LacI family transcriptional regulator